MGLSRLENFLKSVKGNIIYVDKNGLDSTDNISNTGNSLSRPFKSVQRALAESTRFSYQSGINNDRFNKTTIIVYPGDYTIDNRPGWIVDSSNSFYLRSGETETAFNEWNNLSNFDIESSDNELYQLNSIHGGVIVPRGTSIIALDLRKTIFRPTYAPNPQNDSIERSCIFRFTGGCYFKEITFKDGNQNGGVFKDYTKNKFASNFSHHKLDAFQFIDGKNNVKIDDDFLTFSSEYTDLDMYYQKISLVYGPSSGREIDSASVAINEVDIEPVIDEYRIVGTRGDEIGITSIRSGDGVTPSNFITVTLSREFDNISVDTPIDISGVNESGYDGQFIVYAINSTTELQYRSSIIPIEPLPTIVNASLNISVDTVTSSSPYIKSCSLRSVWGMCGLLADGDVVDGFKSVVVAEFTGIGLQKDDNAFIKYDSSSGEYKDLLTVSNLHTDSLSIFKPSYENYHIKATNNSFLQLVSVFAIGYAKQFVVESGGELEITNSNSNFGAKSLVSEGYQRSAFVKDDTGYITHIIPSKVIENTTKTIEFLSIDVGLTTSVSIGATNYNRLYLYNGNNINRKPLNVIDGYRIGSKIDETLYCEISQSGITSTYSASIILPTVNGNEYISTKEIDVHRKNNNLENSIVSNVITLTGPHDFQTGEQVRIYSDNGHLPDGLSYDTAYFIISSDVSVGLGSTEIKLAKTLSSAVENNEITVNYKGGKLSVISRVVDKNTNDIGHPIQWDSDNSNWYINVSIASSQNNLYNAINSYGVGGIGNATPRTYITRFSDDRKLNDTIQRVRYVVPKESELFGRSPTDGFILQESNSTGLTLSELSKYYSTSIVNLSSPNELRISKFISDATWNISVATIKTELNHNCIVGTRVRIENVTSSSNTSGIYDDGYNGEFIITSVPNSREFTYSLPSDPGTFTNDLTIRNLSLPIVKKQDTKTTFQIYKKETLNDYIPNIQDGVYHLTLINTTNSPLIAPFTDIKLSQPIQELYPRKNRDNPKSDVEPAITFALPNIIGSVVSNNPENSITKETSNKLLRDFNIGIGITQIETNVVGTSHTIYTEVDHGYNGISRLSIISGGSNYIQGTYFGVDLVGYAGSTTGLYGSARIEVGAGGSVTSIQIMARGSAYGIGNTISAIPAAGIGTTTGFVPATLRVDGIQNNINDTLEISNVSNDYSSYNTHYRITSIVDPHKIIVSSASTITNSSGSVGITTLEKSVLYLTGKSLLATSFVYDSISGIATVGFNTSHGLYTDNSIIIGGVESEYFNQKVYIENVPDQTSITVNYGAGGVGLSTGGVIYCYKNGYESNNGNISLNDENISGRLSYNYAGIGTVILAELTDVSISDQLVISNAVLNGFQIGDYLQINDEIFRIKTTVSGNTVNVYRSLFGSKRQTHSSNSLVNKIKILPTELRRNSIISASGHTFAYVGFGPGNYSSAFPERQTRELSGSEVILAQSSKFNGGIVDYTAKSSTGHYYNGNKKIKLSSGEEELYDSPLLTVLGEQHKNNDSGGLGFNLIKTDESYINRTIQVDGGENKDLLSTFNGPILINNKLTSTSDNGVEVKKLYINGEENVSREFTVSSTIPNLSGTYGDISFNSLPVDNSNVGWIYTTDNEWRSFGWINNNLFGVGVSSNSGTVGFSTQIDFVGVGITVITQYDENSRITTVRFSGDPLNTVGIYTGTNTTTNYTGNASSLKFSGSPNGFELNVYSSFDSVSGFTTIFVENPLDVLNFTNTLGKNIPTFTTRSSGTRVVYYDSLDSTNVDFASGIGINDSLWFSVPKNDGAYAFKWYGGTTEIARLVSDGALTIYGTSSGSRLISTTTTLSPISVASSIKVDNLNSDYLDGYGADLANTPNTIPVRGGGGIVDASVSKLVNTAGVGQTGGYYEDISSRLGYTPLNKAGDQCIGISTFYQISDVINNSSFGGGSLSVSFADGPIRYISNNTVSSLNITSVSTGNNKALNYTLIMETTSTTTLPSTFQINGSTVSIKWLNGISPSGTTAGTYFMGFTFLRISSTWKVLGVFAKYS